MLRFYYYPKSKGKVMIGKHGGNITEFVFLLKITLTSAKRIEELRKPKKVAWLAVGVFQVSMDNGLYCDGSKRDEEQET